MPKRFDLISITILLLAFIVLYYPIWITEYVYTDEVVQLWYYGKQPGFEMFFQQGRDITELLMQWLFGSMDTIKEIKFIRIFSFLGWILALPVWYYGLKSIFIKEGFPVMGAFFCTLYLICMPPLKISVVWASCLELFLANTTGFLSGYFMYRAIKIRDNRVQVSSR